MTVENLLMVRFVQQGKILNLSNSNFQGPIFFLLISENLLFHVPFLMVETCKFPSFWLPPVFGGIS